MAFNNLTRAGAAGRVSALKQVLGGREAEIFDKSSSTFALESMATFNSSTLSQGEQTFENVSSLLAGHYGVAADSVAIESATRAAMMLADSSKYNQKFRALAAGEGVATGKNVFGISPGYKSLPSISEAALERFNPQEFDNFRAETIDLNYRSVKASPATELMYPTVQVGGEFAGVSVDLNRTVIQANLTNQMDGSEFDQGYRNVLDGLRDSAILRSEGNRLIARPTEETAAFFADAAVYPVGEVKEHGKTIQTAPLATFGKSYNLLSLCTTSGRMGEDAYTSDDMIDRGLSVESVHLRVGDAAAQNFEVSLHQYPSATFLAGAMIDSDSTTVLNFHQGRIVVNIENLKNAKGEALTAFDTLLGLANPVKYIVISGSLSGRMQHSGGNISLSQGIFEVVDYLDAAKKSVAVTEEQMITLVQTAYELKGTLSNANIRQVGTLVDTQSRQITFPLFVGAPISCRRPQSQNNVDSEIQAMAEARIIRTDGDAIKFTLDSVTHLAEACELGIDGYTPQQLQTPGAFYVKPWVKSLEVTLGDIVNTEVSSLKEIDAASAIVGILADTSSVMLVESNYLAAKRAGKQDSSAKVKWGIVTTPQIARLLYLHAEERTFGGAASDVEEKPVIATTVNKDFEGKIFMFPLDETAGTYSGFGWGTRFLQPSVVTETNMGHGQSQIKLLQTIPVERFTVDMPLGFMLTISDISDFLQNRQAALREYTNGSTGAAGTMDVQLVGVDAGVSMTVVQDGPILIDDTTPVRTTTV